MSKAGKWDTHQQLRAKINAEKEAANSTSKPLSLKVNTTLVVEPEKVTEAKIEAPIEVVTETETSAPEVDPDPRPLVERFVEEIKPELKPISKKNKTKE